MFDALGNLVRPEDAVCWAARVEDKVTLRFGTVVAVNEVGIVVRPTGMRKVEHRIRRNHRVLRLSGAAWLKDHVSLNDAA